MKRKIKIKSLLFFLGLMLLMIACTPEKPELGSILDKTALKFTVTVDSKNPNKLILVSSTPGVSPLWITPVGRSTRLIDTIDIPFPGKDTILYSVESAGGIAQADPYPIEITTIDSAYVSTPKWIALTGGYKQSKSWRLDVDTAGNSLLFGGPLYFAGTDYSWEWDAGWASWIMDKGDYGTMTFDLVGAPNLNVDNKMIPSFSGTGTFMLDADKMTLSAFGVDLLHDKGQGAGVPNWRSGLMIKKLNTDSLQIVVVRDASTWLIYNYLSKDYYDLHHH